MGEIHIPSSVQPVAGLLVSEPSLLQQTKTKLEDYFGVRAQTSEPIRFEHTRYYEPEMGPNLLRQFLVFAVLRAPDELAAWKIYTNELEKHWKPNPAGGRCVNVDPGYLAPGKLVLASTKDHEHRLYLQQGIYAEVTLKIRQHRFQAWPWTYPDYAQAVDFFTQAYQHYLKSLEEEP